MIRIGIIILIVTLLSNCKRQSKLFDEIHLTTDTDSSYLQLIVTEDSVLIFQLEQGECDPYMGCEYGPKYFAQVSKTNDIFRTFEEEAQRILSDTFSLENITITHNTKSSLKFLLKDSLIEDFRYYGSEANGKDIVSIEDKIFNLIRQTAKINISITDRLFDVSNLLDIDSISINKLKPQEINLLKGKRTIYITDYRMRMITEKSQVDSIITIIKNQTILDSTSKKIYGKLIPQYELDFYRNKRIACKMATDLKTMPYTWLQVMKFDSLLLGNFRER